MGWSDDYLEHHGILGQKWGVRRFENKNGHLTPAGLKRYEDGRKVTKKEQRAAYNKKYDEWSAKQDKNDAEYKKVKELRKNLGKTAIGRTIASARNKTDAAKAYNKAFDKWSNQQDKLDEEWENVKASKPGLSDKQKKVIIAGAAVVGTTLAAYGGYKFYQAMDKKATEGLSQKYKTESIKLTDKKYDAIDRMTKWQGNASNYANERNDSSHSSAVRDYAEKARQESLNMAGKAFKDYKDLSAKKGVIDTVAKEKAFSKGEKVDFLKEKAAEKINSTVKRDVIKPNTKDWVADRIKDIHSTDNSKMPIYYTEGFSSGRKVSSKPVQNSTPVNRTSVNKTPIKGSKTFIDASKANDDLVQELLKKNTLRF